MQPKDQCFIWAFLIVIVSSDAANWQLNPNSNLCYKAVEEEYTELIPYGKTISDLIRRYNLLAPLRRVVSNAKHEFTFNFDIWQ